MVAKMSCYSSMGLYNEARRLLNSSEEERLANPKAFQMYEKYGGKDVKPVFKFFYQGGLNIELLEGSHTLTCFYLAQANIKFGKNDKAAYFSAITLKKMLESGSYDMNEWCNNSMGLAEYYKQERYFS